MRFKLNFKGREYEIEISEREEEIRVRVGGKGFSFPKAISEEKEISIAEVSLPKKDFSKKEILAPISGEITEIFVKEGDLVKKGQRVILLSAMKMENEIFSHLEGKVEKVLIEKGERVKANQTLLILK